jgi:hypothetical protein
MRVDPEKCEAAIWRRWYKQYRQCSNKSNWVRWVTTTEHPEGAPVFFCGTHRNVIERNRGLEVVVGDDYDLGFRASMAILSEEVG